MRLNSRINDFTPAPHLDASALRRESPDNPAVHRFLGFALLLAVLAGILAPVRLNADPSLAVTTAVEIQYPTVIGKAYTLQAAVNLTNWTIIGNRVLGHGRSVRQLFSTAEDGASSYAAYRVVEEDGPTNGFAPWYLSGGRLQMTADAASNVVEYLDDHSGRDVYFSAADPFTYAYTRLTENDAQVDRTFTPDRHELVTYSYTGPGLGTWVREEYRQGALERRILGAFRYLADPTNSLPGLTNPPVIITAGQPPAPPVTLSNLVYYVQSGALPDQLTFLTATTGTETSTANGRHVEHGTANSFTYIYTVLETNTASLNISFGYYGFGGDRNEYDLTYTDGPSGTFTRRIYRLGSLASTDTGVFSPFQPQPTSPGGTNHGPGPGDPPPANPAGLTYTIEDDNNPVRLVFQSVTSGIAFDDSAPSEFTFSYQAAGNSVFNLVVQFKPDRWDEYDLTFADGTGGSFVRRSFKKGKLDRTDGGTFSISGNE